MTTLMHTPWRALCAGLLAAGLALAGHGAQAQASVTQLQLSFVQPTGTVGNTDSIDVWLRLTNHDSEPFVVDNSLPNGGLNADLLPTTGYYFDETNQYTSASFASYTDFQLSTAFGCSGSFTTQCLSGPPYNFSFAATASFPKPYSLAAGASHDLLFGSFTPSNGPVADGTYEFYYAALALVVSGLDAQGHSLTGFGSLPTATCIFRSVADCTAAGASTFVRTVSSVPEPGSVALMATGVALLLWRGRRQRRTTA